MAKIAFLGLGVMGAPMAGHLAAAGHDATVYNRTTAKAEAWVQAHGHTHAPSPAAAVKDADFVFCCVGADADLYAVALGADGAFDAMKKDAIFVDNTTASAEAARKLYAEAQKRGIHFLDAPVSGGEAGAVNGKLTVMCGGDESVFARRKMLLLAMRRRWCWWGHLGRGN